MTKQTSTNGRTGKTPEKAEPRLASLPEASRYAGNVHRDTIRRHIAAGRLTGYRFGPRLILVDLNEIDALLRPIPTVDGKSA